MKRQKRILPPVLLEKIKDPKVAFFLNPQYWVKTPLLLVPKSSVRPKRSAPAFDKCVATYVTYNEIFKDTEHVSNSEEEFFENMKEFDFYDSLQALAKLNYLLSDGYYKRDPGELIFVRQLFSGIPRQRLENLWYMGRKLFFRQQLLSLIKVDIMQNDLKTKKKLVGKDLSSFSKLIFRVTDFTEIDCQRKEDKCKIKKEKNDVWLGSFIRNIKFNSSQQFRFTLPRYWTIYFDCLERARKKFPKEAFPIVLEFKKATGLNLELFMFLGFGILGHYLKSDKSILIKKPGEFLISNQFFKNLVPAVKNQANKIFSAISSTKRGFIKSFNYEDRRTGAFYVGFQPIWRKPLFKLNKDAYFLLDIRYLEETMTSGIYAQINDYLLDRERCLSKSEQKYIKDKRNKLNAFVGRGFEIYVNDLFHRLYNKRLTKVLYSEIDGDETGGVDFIIYYPDTLLFIEVTTSSLRHNTILTADLKKIEEEIKTIFFSGMGRKSKGKIFQLDTAISMFIKGKLQKLNIDPKSIKNIYPVLILEKGLPDIPPMPDRYRTYFREKRLLQGYENNFQFIGIEELEIIETLVNKGNTLPSILEERQKSVYKDLPFKNYLYFERKSNLSHNAYLRKQTDKFHKCAVKVFFKKTQTQ